MPFLTSPWFSSLKLQTVQVAINRLTAFQYFVMHDSFRIPPNVQHDLFDEFVGFWRSFWHLVRV
jgi:hypothetical protein